MKYGMIREIRKFGLMFVIRIIEVGIYVLVRIFWVVIMIREKMM